MWDSHLTCKQWHSLGHGEQTTYLANLDLSAAFNTVDHQALLSILKTKYGIEEEALQWFDQYLWPRSFEVIVNGKYSLKKDLTASGPQGSCTRATIFNLHCSLLDEVILKGLQLSSFTDNHSVHRSFKASNREEEADTISSIEHCMLKVKNWMDETCLKMNPSKTEFIYFGYNRQVSKCTIDTINVTGNLVPRTDIIWYLEAWLDSGLT